MHPITAECWDRNTLVAFFILKPKAPEDASIQIEALPVIASDKESVIHDMDKAYARRD